MHEHDLDLIAALAEGSLDNESEARALVDTCEVCRAEHRSQTELLALLAATPGVRMTELEKAALHRDLWTELRREPAPAAASTPWWQRWSYVAAALLVTVGLVAVLDNGLQGDGEGADTLAEISADQDAAAPAGEDGVPFVAQDRADEGGAESAVTTTAAGEESLTLPFPELAEAARAQQQADPGLGTMSVNDQIEECLIRVGLDEQVVVEEIDLDQTYLLVMPDDPEAEPTVTFVTLADCEIVYVDR